MFDDANPCLQKGRRLGGGGFISCHFTRSLYKLNELLLLHYSVVVFYGS